MIAIEPYSLGFSERLKELFEETRPHIQSSPVRWIGVFVSIWIIAVAALSIWDPSMSMVANLVFSTLTTLVLILVGINRLLVRLGVVLGRGNSVGGVGLVMAQIGVLLEVFQLFVGA